MKPLIEIWLYAMYLTYWIFWLGSMAIFNVTFWEGILIGLIAFVLHAITLQILYWINGYGWLWDPKL